MSLSKEVLREVISLVLRINPEPTDAQIHALAEVIGCDKESLESEMYEMLGECEEETLDDEDLELHADSQDMLDDSEIDPDEMPLQDVAMNDGDPTDDDLGMQQETNDDGPDVHDIGVGLSGGGSDMLNNDGVPDFSSGV